MAVVQRDADRTSTAPERSLLVIGDSSSAHLGGLLRTYVDTLRDEWGGGAPLAITNVSSVGMTTADAVAILRDHVARGDRFDALTIYLGNNDGCGFGYVKRRGWRSSALGARAATWVERTLSPARVRSAPFRYRRIEQRPLSPCVTTEDFGRNLEELIGLARRMGAGVLLVGPAAKTDFVPCNNIGNFIFYKCFGVRDRHPYAAPDVPALERALHAHGAGDLGAAVRAYEALLEGPTREVRRMAMNNLAAIRSERGEHEASLAMLAQCDGENGPMDALIDFNRALALRAIGRAAQAEAMLVRAREHDMGTYRIRSAYAAKIREIAARHAGSDLRYVDLSSMLGDADFVDYCHPIERAHRDVGRALLPHVRALTRTGSGGEAARIRSEPANPDAYVGDRSDFFRYFGIVGTPDGVRAQALVAAAETWRPRYGALLERFTRALGTERADLTILAHPLFGVPRFLTSSPPAGPLDQGALPELYFVRHLLDLYGDLRTAQWLEGRDEVRAFVPDAERLRISLAVTGIERERPDPDRVEAAIRAIDPDEVLARTRELARSHLRREPTVHDRYRTMTYWFAREAMTFGTSSHWSGWLDRTAISRLIETCTLMLHHAGGDDTVGRKWSGLIDLIEQTLRAHREFLAPRASAPYEIATSDLGRHERRLRALLDHPALAS